MSPILLRAPSPIPVKVRGGWSREDPPTALYVWGRWHEVSGTLDIWDGDDHCYFKVVVEGGSVYLIRFNRIDELWSLVKYSRDATAE